MGLGFQSDKGLAEYERLAVAAESLGFDVLSVYGDLYFQPPLVALAAMARVTRRVRLGPACLNPFMLHPVEIAAQTALLERISGGRSFLGLARGAWLGPLGDRQGPSAVAEAAELVAMLLRNDRSGFTGRSFRLPAGVGLEQGPLRPGVPLMIGTWGPRLAGIAGRIADEVKVGGSANPAMVPVMRARIGAAASGPATTRRVGLVIGAVTVVAEDGRAARALAREEVVGYLDVVGALDPTVELEPDLLGRVRARLGEGDRRGAAALVPDEVLARFAFAGTPAEVAAQAAAVYQAGADRVDFGTPHGLRPEEGIRLLGEQVLPALAGLGRGRG